MTKKIDIHLHVRQETYRDDTGRYMSSAGEMIPHLKELGIEKGIILSAGENCQSALCPNQEARAIHEQYPETYAYMCNIDEMEPDEVFHVLRRHRQNGAVGIGELTINRRLDDPLLEAVFDAAGKLQMPVTFHMSPEVGYSYGIVDSPGLPLLEKALKKYPQTIFMAHSPAFWIEISKDAPTEKEERNAWGHGPVIPGGRAVALFEACPNLYGDLSANSAGQAIMRDPEFGLSFLEKFADRLFFATDMINTDMIFPLGAWLDEMCRLGRLSEAAYKKIVRENALRLYFP